MAAATAISLTAATVFAHPATAEECLAFENDDVESPGLTNIPLNFAAAMREAGICVKLVSLPAKRGLAEVKAGRLDGSVLRVPSVGEFFGDRAVMIDEPLASATGLLISFNPALTSMENLTGLTVGVRHGIHWQAKAVPDTVHMASVPEYKDLVQMLHKGRVDAILLDGLNAKSLEADLAGATVTKVIDLSGYPWLRAGLENRAEEIARAIRAFRASGRKFTDPPPLIN